MAYYCSATAVIALILFTLMTVSFFAIMVIAFVLVMAIDAMNTKIPCDIVSSSAGTEFVVAAFVVAAVIQFVVVSVAITAMRGRDKYYCHC